MSNARRCSLRPAAMCRPLPLLPHHQVLLLTRDTPLLPPPLLLAQRLLLLPPPVLGLPHLLPLLLPPLLRQPLWPRRLPPPPPPAPVLAGAAAGLLPSRRASRAGGRRLQKRKKEYALGRNLRRPAGRRLQEAGPGSRMQGAVVQRAGAHANPGSAAAPFMPACLSLPPGRAPLRVHSPSLLHVPPHNPRPAAPAAHAPLCAHSLPSSRSCISSPWCACSSLEGSG